MIHPHKIAQQIKKSVLWLVLTNYGRFSLGIILCLFGVFSEYSTISFLRIGWPVFDYIMAAGIVIIIAQFTWVVIRSIYLWIYNKAA
jgi:hypothetical protein